MKDFVSRLTLVDCIVFLAVLRGGFIGYKSGIFPELLRITSYLITAMVTYRFFEPIAQFLTLNTFLNQISAEAVAISALLSLTFLLTKLLTVLLLRMLKLGEGNAASRLIGVLMGICRWLMLLSLIFMLIDRTPFDPLKADIHERSLTGPVIAQIAPVTIEFLSGFLPQSAPAGK